MTYVVTNNCVKCKYMECVAVCPVDCISEGKNMVVINPVECIDCGLCENACPSSAIYPAEELPDSQKVYESINAVFSGEEDIGDVNTSGWPQHLIAGAQGWPRVGRGDVKPALPGADAVQNEPNKINAIDPQGQW